MEQVELYGHGRAFFANTVVQTTDRGDDVMR
jgi:hypothetical protein